MEDVSGMRCETVTVVGADGEPLIVNKSDFDANPGKWRLVGEAETAPGPVEYDVRQDGKRFYAIDKATGETALDPAGYKTDVDAWTAISTAG